MLVVFSSVSVSIVLTTAEHGLNAEYWLQVNVLQLVRSSKVLTSIYLQTSVMMSLSKRNPGVKQETLKLSGAVFVTIRQMHIFLDQGRH
jgi:hypothetical protein